MDGGSNYASACKLLQAEWPHIEHVPCAAHVLGLLMEDIGKMEWARDVVGRAGDMITFLRIHLWTRAFLRSPELHGGKALQPLRLAGTRFGTLYIAVSRLCQLRSQLLQMVMHDGWKKMKGKKGTKEKKTTACDFEAWVMDVDWWEKAGFFVQLMEVPFMVMRRTDSHAKGMMGAIYDIMLQLTEDMANLLDGDMCKLKEEENEEVQEHLRRRWDESLACPLHVVGRILNPANQLEEIFLRNVDCTKVMREWLARSKGLVGWEGKGGSWRGTFPPPPLPEGYKLEEDGEVEEDEDAICVDEHAHQEDSEEEEGEEEEGREDED
ncbi:unnamed protein product [Closterium sp. NIES-64]|nr:unnamed protein product [Closterium sp. NIES-64]